MAGQLKIVVAGDVDSGKSTLLGRFLFETGSLPRNIKQKIYGTHGGVAKFEFAHLLDSLEEERKRDFTLDTTQAFCRLKGNKTLAFIDVPGHESLLKNMLCGASSADKAILVVDAAKSLEPQTKRHAFILKFLGIKQVIPVVNKIDLIGFNARAFKNMAKEIKGFFDKLDIKFSGCIPVCAREGDNLIKHSKKLPWFNGATLMRALMDGYREAEEYAFRFPVQDVYAMGKKQVGVGTIISGCIRRNTKVEILPEHAISKVVSLEVFGGGKVFASSPASIGIALDSVHSLRRGQILCNKPLPEVSRDISARILCVHAFSSQAELTFACATQAQKVRFGRVKGVWDISDLKEKVCSGEFQENDLVESELLLKQPVAVESFSGRNSLGRFVLKHKGDIYALGVVI